MYKRTLSDAALFLLLCTIAPLVVILVFLLRGVAIVAGALLLLAGSVAFAVSPAFRKWCRATLVEPFVQYRGLKLATDVGFSPAHSWARLDQDVLVGVDDLVQAALGPVDDVQLPTSGLRVERGQPLFELRHGDRSVHVPSPVSGTVVGVNADLRGHPELINSAPFASGWVVQIHSDHPKHEWKRLLHGRRAWAWFQSSADRVIGLVQEKDYTDAGPKVGANQLYRRLDADAWRRLNESMFSMPAAERELTSLQ